MPPGQTRAPKEAREAAECQGAGEIATSRAPAGAQDWEGNELIFCPVVPGRYAPFTTG